jgi:hypothetical protein
MYRAYATRASELGPQYGGGKAEWDNTAIIADELKLRREEAQMLGYRNFAEVSLAPKMAESPQQVIAFLEDSQRARPRREGLDELRAFAAKELGLRARAVGRRLRGRKLRQQRYAFSENEVKQYFPEPGAEGLFTVTKRCSAYASSRTMRRSGTRTCASSASRTATARWSRSSTRPVRTRRQARRRLDGRRACARSATAPCRRRSPT